MGVITQNYMEALGKQIFAKDYILNGLFPCQSSVVKMIELAKVEWKFNDRFEYRMLMSNTNSGGTVNSQVFDENFRLQHPGDLEYASFQVSYGALMDGFNIDMMKQLETRESRAAFNREYAMRLHSMRINVASLFKNLVIHGRYGVIHRITAPLVDQSAPGPNNQTVHRIRTFAAGAGYSNLNPDGTPDPTKGSWVPVGYSGGVWSFGGGLARGDHIRIPTPINVFESNMKNGRLVSRASNAAGESWPSPWGKSVVGEMYVVYDNQPHMLELVYIGDPTGTSFSWNCGDFLEVAGNSKTSKAVWQSFQLTDANPSNSTPSEYVARNGFSSVSFWKWSGGTYSSEYSMSTGAMEGIPDLIPWYTKYGYYDSDPTTRLGINLPFRGQPNRLKYTTEQAGLMIMQQDGMDIMSTLMEAVSIATAVCDYEDVVIFINPDTLTAIGMYEQIKGGNDGGLQVFKEATLDSKLIYQRGITGISFRIGEKIIPNVVKDHNLPTDVILLAPMKDMKYNCWDNAAFEMQQYIQDTFSGKKPPPPKDLSVPKEFATKLDLSSRITYGTPVAADLDVVQPSAWGTQATVVNGFVHPSNSIPVAYHEMGALFTENPYAYTVVKLRNQIVSISDVANESWNTPQ